MKASLRPIAWCLFAALLASASPATARDAYTERSEMTVPATGVRLLDLDNARGTIQLRRSADGKVHLSAYKICRAETDEKAKGLAVATTVQTSREGDRFVLRVKYPQNVRVKIDFWKMLKSDNWENGMMPRIEVRLVAEVPDGVEIHARSASGDITSDGLVASQRIHSSSGDIVVKNARVLDVETVSGDVSISGSGRTRVESASGDLELVGPSGPLDAHTVSGTVVVTQATDSLRITTASGDVMVEDAPKGIMVETVSGEVRVRGAAGQVDLSSASGDIRARVRGPLRRGDLESTSGEVWLDLAGGMDATLDISTASGSIDCRVPLTTQNTGRNTLRGKYGRGGAPIQLRSASGDITVTSGGR